MDIDEIVQHLSIDLLGIVADDDEVIKASNHGEPIAMDPKNRASIAYRNIARRILGQAPVKEQIHLRCGGQYCDMQ